MARYATIDWWYWLATAVLLTVGIIGAGSAFVWVIVINIVQSIHFIGRERSLKAFPVQVRLAYLASLIAAQWPPLTFLYWLQCAGTWASITVDYCPMARILSLIPGNRTQPFSLGLVIRTFFSKPVKGSILDEPKLTS